MNTTAIWLIVLGILILALIGVGVFVYVSGKTTSIPPCPQGWDESTGCHYVQENYADASIATPNTPLYIGDFENNPSDPGPALCEPMWYAIRYVRQSDGGYGPLGAWTTIPVQAGATTLPCPPSGCGTNVAIGPASCNANRAVMGTTSPLQYSIIDGYWANVHRQTGTFDSTSEGDIVGVLIAPFSSYDLTSAISDVIYNPYSPTPCAGCT
jgi:hypothetical protein